MPPFADSLLPHAPAFLAALSRLAGLFVFAPILSSAMLPGKIRAFLAIALTAAVYPTLDHSAIVPLRLDILDLAPAMATEALIGVTIGLIAGLPLMAVQMGGLIMGQQMGMGLATIYNPANDTENDSLGQLLFFLAMGVFVMTGGLDVMVRAVVFTFVSVPIGAFTEPGARSALEAVSGLVASGFELAVRVSAPVLCILSVETVASGLLMKTSPQMNIMAIGFPLRITLGMGALYASLGAVHEAAGGDVEAALRGALEWASSLGVVSGGASGGVAGGGA